MRRSLAGPAILVGLALLAPAARGQERARLDETVTPARSAAGQAAAGLAARQGIHAEMTYATRITGDLSTGWTEVARPESRADPSGLRPVMGRGSTLVVVLVLLVALLLWLRFGGAGMLLRRAPETPRQKTAAPEAWNISAEDQAGDPRALLERIAAMPDRSAALVLLLRHCLLAAAGETDTRLARADTERTAFRRVPSPWRQRPALRRILEAAELAHYGGHPVTEPGFADALDLGRGILLKQGAAHA